MIDSVCRSTACSLESVGKFGFISTFCVPGVGVSVEIVDFPLHLADLVFVVLHLSYMPTKEKRDLN